MKQHPDWRISLPAWLVSEIAHVGSRDVIDALTLHVAKPVDDRSVRSSAAALIQQEAKEWAAWKRYALRTLKLQEPVPPRPSDQTLKLSIGRVPPQVREALGVRAESVGLRGPLYAAAVVMLWARAESDRKIRAHL